MRILLLICLTALGYTSPFAQTALSGIINFYSEITNINFCESKITVSDASNFGIGDLVLLMQMQGAAIDETNSSDFGTITNIGNAGFFERAEISAIDGNIISLKHWLTKNFDPSSKSQLISFPVFENAIVTDTLTAEPWNGTTGGVLAFEVTGELILNEPLDVSGLGFRGGVSETVTPNNCTWLLEENDYSYDASDWRGARKGEGIAIMNLAHASGRGPQATGGGGGNDHNAGGGGGGHAGEGGKGGENEEPSTFGCDGAFPGLGGKEIIDLGIERIFLGGGGGAGHSNNNVGTNGSNGGGIILVQVGNISGSEPIISAKGVDNEITAAGDGGGGGGGGGTIWLNANEVNVSLLLDISGGNGSSVNNGGGQRCFGPGGGGSSGVVITNQLSSPLLTFSFSGGTPGQTTNSASSCNGSNLGAAAGGNGQTFSSPLLAQGIIQAGPAAIIQQPTVSILCIGDTALLQLTASGLELTYQWETDNGSGFVILPEGPNVSGTQNNVLQINNVESVLNGQTFRCIVSSFCDDDLISDVVIIQVEEAPVAAFDFEVNEMTVLFTNESIGSGNVNWDFGDNQTSTEPNPEHNYAGDGSYIVRLMLENDCGISVFLDTVVIAELLRPAFGLDNGNGCTPLTVQFTDETAADVIAWEWDFPGGTPSSSIAQNPQVVYNNAGIFDVTLTVTNDFSSQSISSTDLILVNASPESSFEHSIDGLTVSFNNSSELADNYQWNFGDNSSFSFEENPIHTYGAPGVYEITLLATNSFCGNGITLSIEVGSSAANLLAPNDWQVYPNPVVDRLMIVSDKYKGNLTLELYQSEGKLLHQQENKFDGQILLDMAALPGGVYILKLISEAGIVLFKVVK